MSHSPKPSGTILVVVMVVIVLLTYACYRFVDRAKVEDIASHTRSELVQLVVALDSGEEMLRALAASPSSERAKLGGLYDNQALFRGRIVSGSSVSGSSVSGGSASGGGASGNPALGERACFTVLAPRVQEEAITGIRFGLVNESSKLSLSGLLQWDRVQAGSARRALLQLPGMDASTADALLDWIDTDGTPRESGAEVDEYQIPSDGITPRLPLNAIPRRLEELLPVRGVQRSLLLGLDRNRNYQVSPREASAAELEVPLGLNQATSTEGLPWIYYLTPYAAERNQGVDGRQRIYLNDPDLRRLSIRLSNRYSQQLAQFIVAYRRFGTVDGRAVQVPDASSAGDNELSWEGSASREGASREGASREGASRDGSNSKPPRLFRISSVYDLIGARVQLPGGQGNLEGNLGPILQSPMPEKGETLRRDLLNLVDGLMVDPRPVIYGRVNINEAPQRVLLAIPGIGQELASKIVEMRGEPGQSRIEKKYHEAWLLAEGLVTARQMAHLERMVTARGAVFRGQITSFFDSGTLAVRSEVVVDGSRSPPRIIDRRDLRRLGRGFSLDVLGGGRLSSIEGGSVDGEEWIPDDQILQPEPVGQSPSPSTATGH